MELIRLLGEEFPIDELPDEELLIDSLGEFVTEIKSTFLSKEIPSAEPRLLRLP